MMDLRLRAYAPNGASQGYLPAPDSFSLAIPLNDTPSLTVSYGLLAPRSDLLGKPLELAVEVSGDGGLTWTEPDDCRFLYLRDGRDPVKTSDAWAAEAPGYLWRLTKAKVLASGLATPEGKRLFTAKTPGSILATLWAEAQARGALSGMTLQGTAANDASGSAWATTITREYDLGVDYLSVLNDMAAAGLLDYRMTGRILKLYKPDTTLATDRTVGNSQVQLTGLQLTEAPFRRTWEGLADFLLVAGDEGVNVSLTNAGALKPWGRWEDYITQGGVGDTGTLTALGQRYQTLSATERLEYTQAMALGGDGPRPLIDFWPGDFIWSRTPDGTRTRYRVRQVTLQKDGNTVQGNVVLNDRFVEQDIRTKRALDAITGGASASGSAGPPTLPGADILAPAAPGQPVASSAFYVANGVPSSQITLDWPDVTTNADGTPITDLKEYQVWWRAGLGSWSLRTTVEAGVSAITMSPFPPGSTYDWRVRAVDTVGNLSGFSSVVSLTTATDDTPPPIPSVPTASSRPGVVEVRWDGKDKDGNTLNTPDLDRIVLYASPSGPTFAVSPATQVADFPGAIAGRITLSSLPYGTTQYLRLVSIDSSGNASAASTAGSVQVIGQTDGLAPVPPVGWTPTLTPLGVMGLQAAWPPVTNADPVTYDVYVAQDTVSAAPAPGLLLGSTGATSMSLGRLPDGSLLKAEVEYAVRVVARDADGSGPISAMATSSVRQADGDAISPTYVYTNELESTQIKSGGLEADLAILGRLRTSAEGIARAISLSTEDGFLAEDGDGSIVASIPTDLGSAIQLLAHITAMTMTALGAVAFRSAENEVAQNAAVILRAGTAAPVTPPTPVNVVTTTPTGNADASQSNWYWGMHISNDVMYQAYSVWGVSGVTFLDPATGAITGGFNMPAGWNLFGVVRVNGFLYVLGHDSTRYKSGNQWNPRHYVRKYSLTGVYQNVEWEYAAADDNTALGSVPGNPVIGVTAGGLLLIARTLSTGQVRFQWTGTPDTGASISTRTSVAVSGLASVALGSVQEGMFDYTGLAQSVWIVTTRDRSAGDLVLGFDNIATPSRNTGVEWPVANADKCGGMSWDPVAAVFRHRSRSQQLIYVYDGDKWIGAQAETRRVVNTWYDSDATGGTHQTVMGPPATVAFKKRHRLKVTTPPIPSDPNPDNHDDPDSVRVYVSRLSVNRTDFYLQSAPPVGQTTVILPPMVFSNADTLHPNPPVVGDFPNGTPGMIRADDPTYRFDGDGKLVASRIDTPGGRLDVRTRYTYNPASQAGATGGWVRMAGGSIVVAEAGLYLVTVALGFGTGTAGTAGRRGVGIGVGDGLSSPGSDRSNIVAVANNSSSTMNGSWLVPLTAGETLTPWRYTDVVNHFSAAGGWMSAVKLTD